MYNAKEQPAAKVIAAFSRINQMINTFLNTVTHTIILQQPPVNETESAERTDRAPLHLLSWCPWREKKKVIKRGGGQRQTFSLSHGCLAAHFSGESMYRSSDGRVLLSEGHLASWVSKGKAKEMALKVSKECDAFEYHYFRKDWHILKLFPRHAVLKIHQKYASSMHV